MNNELKKFIKNPDKTLYLIDVSSFIFRAFYAIRMLNNSKGEPTNAVYGVAGMLSRLIQEASPKYLLVAGDSEGPSFRNDLDPNYKANRQETPEDLISQFEKIDTLISAMGMKVIKSDKIEADDWIGCLTKKWSEKNSDNNVVIVSSDKDLMQLINDRVVMWDTMKAKIYGPSEVKEKHGVRPDQIRDYLGLVGDSSDNIKGVPGIGPKTAAILLEEYNTLENILDAAKDGKIKGKRGIVIHENADLARLAACLATVKTDMDIELKEEDYKYSFVINSRIENLFKELEFDSLLSKWKEAFPAQGFFEGIGGGGTGVGAGADTSDSSKGAAVEGGGQSILSERTQIREHDPVNFNAITTREGLARLVEKIQEKQVFAIDLETTSLNPREASIVGLGIAFDAAEAFYVPIGHKDTESPQLDSTEVLNTLRPFIENKKFRKLGQNLKYDFSVLIANGMNPSGIWVDTMVASYVLDPEGRHNLDTLAKKYLNHEMIKFEDVCGKGKEQILFSEVPIRVATRYAAEDVWAVMAIWDKIEPELKKDKKLLEVYENVDLPLVDVLTKIEMNGVKIDEPWLKTLSKKLGEEINLIEKKVRSYSKSNPDINLNSPRQVADLLFQELKLPTQSKIKTGFSTDAKVLDALSSLHEVPALLLEYREVAKLIGTYVDPLPLLVDKTSGRVHTSFHQAVTATGRLSSSNPNLQNIPIRTEKGRLIRKAFVPDHGSRLVSADYSQIELRILAHLSGDKDLSRSFIEGEDVHTRTASEIFGIFPGVVDKAQRSIAKAINFGLMYGKTAFGLSEELKISRKDAKEMIEKYFERYSGVKYFLDSQIERARECGFAQTELGRKRALIEINSKNHLIRSNAERMAMNTPIQGTAADLMKLAMINVQTALEEGKYKSKMILQVHDEVLLECPLVEVDAITKLVVVEMEGAMKLKVPLKVNVSVGDNWMELK